MSTSRRKGHEGRGAAGMLLVSGLLLLYTAVIVPVRA